MYYQENRKKKDQPAHKYSDVEFRRITSAKNAIFTLEQFLVRVIYRIK